MRCQQISLLNPRRGQGANSTASSRITVVWHHWANVWPSLCWLSLEILYQHERTQSCNLIFATELYPVLCPSYYLGKRTRGGGLPSPASVWRWGEVNWAVRTAVNVNLVKANKVDGMKNGSVLIHTFMPLGWFNQIDPIHTHKCYWDLITSVSVLLCNGAHF